MSQTISINKTKSGILASIGLKPRTKKQVFTISEDSFTYNSTLGNLGELKNEMIDFVEQEKPKRILAITTKTNNYERYSLASSRNLYHHVGSWIFRNCFRNGNRKFNTCIISKDT